jgi:sigma-E factor negative regulatory protein RseC
MTEIGVIHAVKGNFFIIAPEKSIECFGCLKEECKNAGKFITAENPASLPLKTGQTVEVKASGFSILGQAFAFLLPPLLGFFAAYALVRILFPKTGEGAAALTGGVFLFTTAFIVSKAGKIKPPGKLYTVSRII